MIPFNYNFETKEVKNFLEGIKYVCIPSKLLTIEFEKISKIKAINNKLFIVIPVSKLTDVTVFRYTVTNTGKQFVALRCKVSGVTQFPENFDNSQIIEDTLILKGLRW